MDKRKPVIDSTTRWAFANAPSPVRLKEHGKLIHPVIKHFDEFTDEQKELLKGIKSCVHQVIPNVKVFVFGSRINGRWRESSDYDIFVQYLPNPKQAEQCKSFQHGVRIDMRFSNGDGKNMVEIL